MFTLARLLAATGGRVVRGSADPSLVFRGGAFDSRILTPGTLFFALRDVRDGHDFVADAIARGARGAVVERVPEGVPRDALLVEVDSVPGALRRLADALRDERPIPAVGITGNVGKTTAKQATIAALGARYRVLGSASSYNNEIGVPLTFLDLEPTHEVAVVELGFFVPGEIADLCRLVRPRVGVITRIPDRPVHFERTPSVEAIAAGKAELIEALPRDGLALLNADDPRVRSLAGRTRARVVLYGLAADAELRARDVVDDGLDGFRFTVDHRGAHAEARVPMPGTHFLAAVLPALGAAVELGVPLGEAAAALATMEPPAHRMAVRHAEGMTVIDDSYNSSPAAVAAALALLRGQRSRRVAVIGDMRELGALSAEAHEDAGRDAARSADVLVTVGDLARTIARVARPSSLDVYEAADAAEAILIVRRVVRPGDVVLVKGSLAVGLTKVVDALVASEAVALH
ncbi:MAG: UDP-N-acetylmuramoyl-tripeptide--D-alanyl-D-alanine ligase [Chloroflexota bacterium]|nr:UDP-N-acetylmuramoyl-tripeptide--D-alanyl-D-alanine ligase [Chloroflexota bacterium]MDE3194027.1 UDP-N-acetylmuramoyl-tripeptide--D-alanyl-D-alanine ligase [Chloroflexota bacterium]